jgi:hypothetical protein
MFKVNHVRESTCNVAVLIYRYCHPILPFPKTPSQVKVPSTLATCQAHPSIPSYIPTMSSDLYNVAFLLLSHLSCFFCELFTALSPRNAERPRNIMKNQQVFPAASETTEPSGLAEAAITLLTCNRGGARFESDRLKQDTTTSLHIPSNIPLTNRSSIGSSAG